MRLSDRNYNRLRVFRALRRAEPVGRTDLAVLSRLDGGTITEIAGALLDRGLIFEEKVSTGKRGRPQLHLRLNPEGAYGLAAYIGIAGRLVCEIVNLRGDQVYLSSRPQGVVHTIEEFARVIAANIDDMIRASGHDRSTIARLGLALPAVVDSENGVIHWVQTLAVSPYPAAALIEQIIGIPVSIDNNTNVLARAEHWFGVHEQLDDFSVINLGYGISAAHYANGLLTAGAHGLNSELGHGKIVVDDGLPCACGARGCLDAYCSIGSIVRQVCEATSTPMPDPSHLDATLSAFADQARAGRGEVREIFERAGRYLGVAIANHINGHDPGRVILMCQHPDLPTVFSNTIPAVEANCLPPMRAITTLEFRGFEEDLFRKGAAALVLEQLYRTL